ncbi:hypothetical protein BJ875DRAFT_46713 [Amylocarpus encephaloides]|uniref:Uncharacterized protein n=1 Tax=Amylocarpus encephaloides TaxID=45428 RepID=A0A9P8C9E9_9HELO|nr:hypothetical protein BJ875DRAFT_46713 [Amylocarpus encephaloides]
MYIKSPSQRTSSSAPTRPTCLVRRRHMRETSTRRQRTSHSGIPPAIGTFLQREEEALHHRDSSSSLGSILIGGLHLCPMKASLQPHFRNGQAGVGEYLQYVLHATSTACSKSAGSSPLSLGHSHSLKLFNYPFIAATNYTLCAHIAALPLCA